MDATPTLADGLFEAIKKYLDFRIKRDAPAEVIEHVARRDEQLQQLLAAMAGYQSETALHDSKIETLERRVHGHARHLHNLEKKLRKAGLPDDPSDDDSEDDA